MTTIDTITADQCGALREEAALAGDERMERIAAIAERFLNSGWAGARDESAVRTCLAAIRDAEAMR